MSQKLIAHVAVADIGAVAFASSRAQTVSPAGDSTAQATSSRAATSSPSSRVSSVTYFQVLSDAIRQRMGEDGVKMYEWFDRVGFAVDRAALRRAFPDVAFRGDTEREDECSAPTDRCGDRPPVLPHASAR